MANLALDGGDPRLHQAEQEKQASLAAEAGPGGLRPHQRPIHDSSISFEEYHHYALKTRAEELNFQPQAMKRNCSRYFSHLNQMEGW